MGQSPDSCRGEKEITGHIWASTLMTPFLPSVLSLLPSGVYILIGAGALMMLVGFLGCCGAVQESQCMLGLVSTPSAPRGHSDPQAPTPKIS